MAENKTVHRLSGPREGVWLMRLIAELMEKHPEIKMPSIDIGSYGGDVVRFYAFGHDAPYDFRASAESRAAAKLRFIETRFNTITEFFPDLDWVANDPASPEGVDKTYFILRALYAGVVLEIMAQRADVGESVQELETGPEVSEIGDGYMQAVVTTVTTWRPNITLTALATPGHQLPAPGQLLAVEA